MEDSKDSCEDSDRPEPVKDTARFYECTFCRRGFSTAQALGGHMNIHRRDRAKMRQPSLPSFSRRPANDPPSPNSDVPLTHHPPYNQSENYRSYLPSSTSSSRRTQMFHADGSSARVPPLPQQLNLFGEESNPRPGSRVMYRSEEEKKNSEDGELDLELRLGHEP